MILTEICLLKHLLIVEISNKDLISVVINKDHSQQNKQPLSIQETKPLDRLHGNLILLRLQ